MVGEISFVKRHLEDRPYHITLFPSWANILRDQWVWTDDVEHDDVIIILEVVYIVPDHAIDHLQEKGHAWKLPENQMRKLQA